MQNEKILKENDFVLAVIGTIGKINIVNKNYIGGTFSNNTSLLRLKNEKEHNPLFLIKLFQSNFIQNIMNNIKNQKAQPVLQSHDLLNLKIPNIPLATQNSTAEKILPIENKIKELKAKIKDTKLIINEVFAREFGFNFEEFDNIRNNEKINIVNFSFNRDLRNSAKFHRRSYNYLINFLKNKNFRTLKNFVSEPIILGASIGQSDIEENGEYYYISLAELKNYIIDLENVKKVSSDFFKKKIDKSIKYGDILIARSGEGTIGKCAIMENEDIEGLNADFIIKVRINDKIYDKKFAFYYFYSFYFQYMVEINKKGLGNNTNIFPSQISNFLIPDISLSQQQKIVEEIKKEIDKQNEFNIAIANERKKIDDLIESVLI